MPFPWLRFVLAALVLAALSGLGGWLIATHPAAEALRSAFAATRAVLERPQVSMAMGTTLGSLVGTYLLVRLTLGWTGARG